LGSGGGVQPLKFHQGRPQHISLLGATRVTGERRGASGRAGKRAANQEAHPPSVPRAGPESVLEKGAQDGRKVAVGPLLGAGRRGFVCVSVEGSENE
jgi:hypothetical protein